MRGENLIDPTVEELEYLNKAMEIQIEYFRQEQIEEERKNKDFTESINPDN
ncbi:MAG TPA: hypothetical protein VF596_14805 [Pyrinomonadaceae bacterium]|jgi:hypothetical protein